MFEAEWNKAANLGSFAFFRLLFLIDACVKGYFFCDHWCIYVNRLLNPSSMGAAKKKKRQKVSELGEKGTPHHTQIWCPRDWSTGLDRFEPRVSYFFCLLFFPDSRLCEMRASWCWFLTKNGLVCRPSATKFLSGSKNPDSAPSQASPCGVNEAQGLPGRVSDLQVGSPVARPLLLQDRVGDQPAAVLCFDNGDHIEMQPGSATSHRRQFDFRSMSKE